MKKIIIIGGGIFCILAFLIFMAQTCEEGAGGEVYPSIVGNWSDVYMESPGYQSYKVDLSLTENSWEMNYYEEGDSWDYMFGVKGTLTISGDNFTMAINGGRTTQGGSWYNFDTVSCGGEECSGVFYDVLTYIIETPYDEPYYQFHNDFNLYAAYYYSTNENFPELKGKFSVSSTGNSLILYFTIWGANYFNDYHGDSWDEEFIPQRSMIFTKVQ